MHLEHVTKASPRSPMSSLHHYGCRRSGHKGRGWPTTTDVDGGEDADSGREEMMGEGKKGTRRRNAMDASLYVTPYLNA